MTEDYRYILLLLKHAIWDSDISICNDCNWKEIEKIVRKHRIDSILITNQDDGIVPRDTRNKWIAYAAYQIRYNNRLLEDQDYMIKLLSKADIPVVILKGAAASQYYMRPELRPMGDIDFIVPRDSYERAYNILISNGFKLVCKRTETERNIKLSHNGYRYELHRYFATSNNAIYAQRLDDQIMQNIAEYKTIDINGFLIPVLPDITNGLVLLQHINQHIESGLGLRQIIDWMMFYSKVIITEAERKTFYQYVEEIGLKKLEKYITAMCATYLGLNIQEGMDEPDKAVCYDLLIYILSSGNFGNNLEKLNTEINTVMNSNQSIRQWIQMLYRYGNEHWKAAQKYPVLRSLAVFYQIFYYIKKLISEKASAKEIGVIINDTKRKRKMMDSIGAKTKSKGSVVYKNGKYEIKK